jgi:hypothetical protein
MTSDQQTAWQAEREKRGLGAEGKLAPAGLMTYLDEPLLLVTVIPSDPLATPADFDADLLEVLPQRFAGQAAQSVGLLGETVVTTSALARTARGTKRWRAYAAIRRCGAIEVGIGSHARYQTRDSDTEHFAYKLCVVIHAIRVVVESQARLNAKQMAESNRLGPFELIVAITKTMGSVLGCRAPGWQDPYWFDDEPTCTSADVRIRMQLEDWPAIPEEQELVLVKAGDRVCNAFGRIERLYVPPAGHPDHGVVNKQYA